MRALGLPPHHLSLGHFMRPAAARPRWLLSRLWIAALCMICFVTITIAAPARAQSLLRDPDIEYALTRLAQPIFEAAGLPAGQMKVILVKDDRPNAFVVDNRHIFIHSGLMLRLKTAGQLQAVIAHEAAHIASGHITRRHANLRSANRAAALGILLSGVVAAGTGNAEAASGVALGVAGSSQRVFFGHTRAEEASADQAGVRYLTRAGISPEAMVEVLDIFRGQEVLSTQRQDPYARTHPLTRDRIRSVEGLAAASSLSSNPDGAAQYWYARARGKLEAFIRAPSYTLRRVKASDTSDISLMRRAVALHRQPKPKEAIATINKLVSQKPNDPYYAELQGQILLESRNFAAAVQAYRRAASLAGSNAQIQAGLGRALLATGDSAQIGAAIKALEKSRSRDPYDARVLRHLASAYAQSGKAGLAALNAAESHALRGDFKAALPLAKRATAALGHGTVGWNRAQDVIDAAQTALNRR